MIIDAEFHVSPKVFEVIKENIENVNLIEETIIGNDIFNIEQKVYGLKLKISISAIDTWVSNIKVTELFGVMTLFMQTPNMSLELRTENYTEVDE